MVKKLPGVQRLADDTLLWRLYGRWRPDCVTLPGTERQIFVDPLENRGLALLKNRAAGQPFLKRFWKSACAELRPTAVLDIGLNYGEIVLAETYPPATKILGIEANPALTRWLERSRQIHPNATQLQFVYALAGEQAAGEENFYINEKWSGSSSAILDPSRPGVTSRTVPCVSVDGLWAGQLTPADRLLFKIDVEGYEPPVLRGMRQTLATCGQWLGIIEFNEEFFPRLGIDAGEFVAELAAQASLIALCHNGQLRPLPTANLDDWHMILGEGPICVDLILVSRGWECDFLSNWLAESAHHSSDSHSADNHPAA
ncbi:MAG: FkbM family methyltransferase [Pirellulales bacterium]|nr:FkbM family methyltransferase [Pirellulales bacterium]